MLGDSSGLGGSSLVDSSATSPLAEEGKRRRLYRWLCSRKDDGDLDGELESVAFLGDTAMSQTVGLVDEGKRRSDYWWLSETQINAAKFDTWMDQDAQSRFKTKINGVCCSGSGDGWMKTHDPGSPDQRRTLVDRGQCEKMEQWEWNNHGVSVN
ncbi:hypothetical protein HID58_082082 [Brassica napus]|uniref:Uncharacterized protein n=1 Tax=Brassica napus TaxID=3708 RepID=A0ABQ7Y9K3_BRANA|nr:hypothetical protein HID58_082082 [Brassica napus]